MSKLHPSVVSPDLPGLDGHHMRTGKVRDSYALRERDELVVVASDRISIFDFVLRALVPEKGAILTAMNVFWRRYVLSDVIRHDLVACGSAVAQYLPPELRENLDLLARTSVVHRLDMLSCEAIARGYLTGSGLKAYHEANRTICGHRLPAGLQDGDELPYPVHAQQ